MKKSLRSTCYMEIESIYIDNSKEVPIVSRFSATAAIVECDRYSTIARTKIRGSYRWTIANMYCALDKWQTALPLM